MEIVANAMPVHTCHVLMLEEVEERERWCLRVVVGGEVVTVTGAGEGSRLSCLPMVRARPRQQVNGGRCMPVLSHRCPAKCRKQ